MTDVNKIEELIAKELEAMCKKQDKFNSKYEAYAFTHAIEENVLTHLNIDIDSDLHSLWFDICGGSPKKEFNDSYNKIRKIALNTIQELIKLCACCDKAVKK